MSHAVSWSRSHRLILGVVVILNAAPAHAQPTPRTDLYGDELPPGAVARLGTVRFRLAQSAWALALTPDDKLVVTGGYDGVLSVWDRATGRPLRRWRAHDRVHDIALSPDGKTAAAAGVDKKVSLWDVATGKSLRQLGDEAKEIFALAFSADGATLYGRGEDGSVRVWRVGTGEEVARWRGNATRFARIACSPDGKTLAVGYIGGYVLLWDTATGRERRRLRLTDFRVSTDLSFSGDGRLLATLSPDAVVVWNTDTGEEEGRIPFEKDAGVFSLAFAADGKHLAGGGVESNEGVVWLWDWPGGRLIHTFRGHSVMVWALRFTSDGKQIVSSGNDHKVRLWDVAALREALPTRGPLGAVRTLAFAPDGRTLAMTDDARLTLRLWDVATSAERFAVGGPRRGFVSAAFTPDGRGLVAGTSNGTVFFLDAETGDDRRRPLTRPGGVVPAALSPDGTTLVTLGKDGVGEWNLAAGKETRSTPLTDRVVEGLWARDRPLVVLQQARGDSATVSLRDVRSGRQLGQFDATDPALKTKIIDACAALTPDHRRRPRAGACRESVAGSGAALGSTAGKGRRHLRDGGGEASGAGAGGA